MFGQLRSHETNRRRVSDNNNISHHSHFLHLSNPPSGNLFPIIPCHQTTRPRPPRRIRTFFPHSVRCFFCLASSSVSGFYYGIMALLGENTSRNYSTASRQAFPKVQNTAGNCFTFIVCYFPRFEYIFLTILVVHFQQQIILP